MTREQAIEILRHYDDLVWQQENKVTMGMIADAIRMGEEALQSTWRSVKEELPDHHQWCFTCSRDGDTLQSVGVSLYNKITDDWTDEEDYFLNVDYWMPSPNCQKKRRTDYEMDLLDDANRHSSFR